jgi:hypothetical protein
VTQNEKDFMKYWESNREKEGHLRYQVLAGIPMGICFGVPILLCFFSRGWYKWLPFVSDDELLWICIGVLGIVFFYAVFRQKYRWEKREQRYLELRAKAIKEGDIII